MITASSGYVAVDGVRIHYLRWGHGPSTIVILHPNSHCAGVWTPLAERLAGDTFTVIAVDLRGHGGSDKPSDGYHWAQMRDDIVTVFRSLELHDVLLVGHSRGGGVSLLTAAALPERIRGVMVYEPTIPFRPDLPPLPAGSPAPPITARMSARARERRTVFPSRAALFDHWRTRDAFRRWRDEYLRAFVEHGSIERADGTIELACPPWVEARMYEVMLEQDAWTGVRAPEMPLLAIYGAKSGRLAPGRDQTPILRRMFPCAEVRVMDGATHFGPMEQPEVFEQILRGFAAQVGAGSAAAPTGDR